MKIRFIDLFEIIKEIDNSETPNLTEERIYTFCQDIFKGIEKVPVFSGSTLNEGVVGYIPNYIKERSEEIKQTANSINYYHNRQDCITIVADGKVGYMFYRESKKFPIFCMNIHCLAIFNKDIEIVKSIKEEYSEFDGLNLKWFYFRFNNMFKNLIRWEGVPSFSKAIYSQIELEIPSLEEQESELKNYEEMYNLLSKTEKIIDRIQRLKEKHIVEEEKFEPLEETPVTEIFETISGNSGLTEEYIYSLVQIEERDIDFLGGSLNAEFYKIPLCRHPKNTNKNINFLDDKEGLLIIRKGKAGKLIYLKREKYATNDDAYILYLNEKYKNQIKLKWVMYQYQKLFLEFSSNSDNGTWNKTNFLAQAKIKVFPKEEQEEVIGLYEKLEVLEEGIYTISKKINKLFEKELIL